MTQMKTTIVFAAAGMLLAGCANPEDGSAMKDFFPADGSRRITQMLDAQAAKGAAEDATLQKTHFDGAKLNSLGQAKLDAMIPVDPEAEIKVYLNLSEKADDTAARKDAVNAYLASKGVDAAHVKLTVGPNEGVTTPAALGLAGLAKTDSGAGGAEPSSIAAEGMK